MENFSNKFKHDLQIIHSPINILHAWFTFQQEKIYVLTNKKPTSSKQSIVIVFSEICSGSASSFLLTTSSIKTTSPTPTDGRLPLAVKSM